eukprot:SAG11_NODE_2541_length_3241_cov_4.313495_1_plen_112_part_00
MPLEPTPQRAQVAGGGGMEVHRFGELRVSLQQARGASLGSHIWGSAPALCTFLVRECTAAAAQLRGKMVVELGAGLGLCGLVAALLGADVLLTERRGDPVCEQLRYPLCTP